MKKNIREYKRNGKQFAYVLDSICTENFDTECKTDKDKITFFFDTFNKEFNYLYNRKRYPNLQNRIGEYLRGLPSCICLPFYADAIEKTLQSLGVKNIAKDNYELENNWYKCISLRLIQIANYYNINLIY